MRGRPRASREGFQRVCGELKTHAAQGRTLSTPPARQQPGARGALLQRVFVRLCPGRGRAVGRARGAGRAGEVTLTGRILPIGGVKEKALAARRAGVTTILFPEANRADYEELSGARACCRAACGGGVQPPGTGTVWWW